MNSPCLVKKYKQMEKLLIISLLFKSIIFFGQSKDAKKIYRFQFQNKTYEVVKIPKTWQEAAAYAVARGGYLAEINSMAEQKAIYYNLIHKAQIKLDDSRAQDGGGASYVWLGGNDIAHEGLWIWDGNNDGIGIAFWQGNYKGHALNNAFTNWGHEPDNYNNQQDALAMGLTEWPRGLGSLGKPGQWNDLNQNDRLFFVIEYKP